MSLFGAQSPVMLVLLPLVTAAVMLLMGESRRASKAVINLTSTVLGLAIASQLWLDLNTVEASAAYSVHLPGNWPVPFGIVLVADRLSALLVMLSGLVGLASLLFALARWQHAGVYFHVLFQMQLMGLYGAFLTADLFNLFVFFEVLLAASYGLLLHGGGPARVRTGLHYIAINLLASLLFLIGIALLYGVTGTLNMADLAEKLIAIPESDRGLLHAGAAIMAVAFLAKAGLWPLNFWLPPAYGAASAPAAAMFAILTKVGVYAVLRLWTLCFPTEAGPSAGFGGDFLIWGGILTLAFGASGMLASQRLVKFAGYAVISSSGILIAALGFAIPALTSAAIFYLVSSTLAACSLFLLVELMERARQVELGPRELDDGTRALPAFTESALPMDVNLDDDRQPLIGRAIPASLVVLGLSFFITALATAGLPPLSGFIAKLGLLSALLEINTLPTNAFFVLLIVAGLFAAIALMRIGIRQFWVTQERPAPQLRVIEVLPIAWLALLLIAMVIFAEPALEIARATAETLMTNDLYVDAVLSAGP